MPYFHTTSHPLPIYPNLSNHRNNPDIAPADKRRTQLRHASTWLGWNTYANTSHINPPHMSFPRNQTVHCPAIHELRTLWGQERIHGKWNAHAFKARIHLAQMTDGRKQTCQKWNTDQKPTQKHQSQMRCKRMMVCQGGSSYRFQLYSKVIFTLAWHLL